MSLPHHAHTVSPGEGRTANLGVAQMRVLAAGKDTTDGAFTLAEFTGGPGPWTVPHIHQAMEESFYVLDGAFTFFELADLSPDAITDPAVRAAISARHDSVPA
jgi:quercetin dioxygenase-like cupin family protein